MFNQPRNLRLEASATALRILGRLLMFNGAHFQVLYCCVMLC